MSSTSWHAITAVDIYVTFECNRRCEHCFVGREQLNSAQEMPYEMVMEVVHWAESLPNVESIVLLGGEPTLHSRFEDILASVTHSPLDVRLVTNGNSRARVLCDPFLRTLSRVYVSVDGSTEELNDATRGRGSYRDAIAMIEQVVTAGTPLTINCTPAPETLDDLPRMVGLSARLGAEVLNVHWPSEMGSCTPARSVSSAEAWLGAEQETIKAMARLARPMELHWQLSFTRTPLDACVLKKVANLQVMPDGSAYVCGLMVDRPGSSMFIWTSDGPRARVDSIEQQMVAMPHACPARSAASGGEFHPVCIYHRSHYASTSVAGTAQSDSMAERPQRNSA